MVNDIWQNTLNFHQGNVQAKDDENMLLVSHLVLVESCTTSLNVLL